MNRYHQVINGIEDEISNNHLMDEQSFNELKGRFGKLTKDNIGLVLQTIYDEAFRNGLRQSLEIIRTKR